MAETGGRSCGTCCCNLFFTTGLTALFIWLSLRTSKPTCSIQEFYVPALNTTNNSTKNHTIYFDIKLKNTMKDKGVCYGDINLTFYYSSSAVANYTVPGFYQGHGKKARRRAAVEAMGLPWEAAVAAVSNGSTTVNFRVGLATRVKFKITFWYTKRHGILVGGDVAVDGSGRKVGSRKKGIKMKSGGSGMGSRRWVGFGSTVVLILLMW